MTNSVDKAVTFLILVLYSMAIYTSIETIHSRLFSQYFFLTSPGYISRFPLTATPKNRRCKKTKVKSNR
jgi:hypothetical protein